jgi:hypothetical protein
MNPNKQANEYSEERVAEIVDAMYDDYLDEMTSFNDMMEYAAHSYDSDAAAYGEY